MYKNILYSFKKMFVIFRQEIIIKKNILKNLNKWNNECFPIKESKEYCLKFQFTTDEQMNKIIGILVC